MRELFGGWKISFKGLPEALASRLKIPLKYCDL
jgi:hypothetical protein